MKPVSKAKVILVGSSILVSKKVLSRRSPLLGIVKPVRVGLIRPVNVLLALSKEVRIEKALKLAPLLRDPWILEFVDIRASLRELVRQVVSTVRYGCKGLQECKGLKSSWRRTGS